MPEAYARRIPQVSEDQAPTGKPVQDLFQGGKHKDSHLPRALNQNKALSNARCNRQKCAIAPATLLAECKSCMRPQLVIGNKEVVAFYSTFTGEIPVLLYFNFTP